MALCMPTSYEPQVAQVNEELALDSFLDLTLTHRPHDEDPELREVRACYEVNPPQAWYYHISPNSRTLVILLQVDLAFGDEPDIIYEACYKTKDTFIFAWFSILNVGHYHWLCGPIRQLPPNSKTDYLVHTIRRMLDFLQL